MLKPELFDIVELLVNLPEHNQFIGSQGAIVHRHDDNNFEVEFSNDKGETISLCSLPDSQFVVVWQSSTKQWLPVSKKIVEIIEKLSENKQEEIFNYARSLYQQA